MKKILITGANSYIGVSFEQHMAQFRDAYQVETLDVIGDAWKQADLSGYDVVFHVAGITHQKETKENVDIYYRVNRDLAVEIARKAKADGVSQFVFMSSMSVYGMDSGVITPATKPAPVSHYGKSKLEAEKAMAQLQDEHFQVAVLRPPMVYGKGCRGNFQLMLRLVQKSPVFPVVENRRSMISVRNLCAFVHMVIEKGCSGVFFPQNKEYANTTQMAIIMADTLNRRVIFSKGAGIATKMLIPVFTMARKAFSTLIYQDCEQFDFCYCQEDMESSVRNSI
jgi:UDP-glucose 4-epimerase